jgi:hypothetical protein
MSCAIDLSIAVGVMQVCLNFNFRSSSILVSSQVQGSWSYFPKSESAFIATSFATSFISLPSTETPILSAILSSFFSSVIL